MTFLDKIRTKEDLEFFSADIEQLRDALYKTNGEVKVPAIIQDDFINATDKNKFLDNVHEQILSSKTLEITTAAYLDEPVLNKISEWVKANIGSEVVLEIKVDPKIFAGAIFSFNGKYKDFSFKDSYEKIVAEIS